MVYHSLSEYGMTELFCGYKGCNGFYYKHRGFMPCCKEHYQHPKKNAISKSKEMK